MRIRFVFKTNLGSTTVGMQAPVVVRDADLPTVPNVGDLVNYSAAPQHYGQEHHLSCFTVTNVVWHVKDPAPEPQHASNIDWNASVEAEVICENGPSS
jgi:hypothetical protein